MPRKTRLWVDSIRSFGFVDKGACEGSAVVIAKRADTGASDIEKRASAAREKLPAELVAKIDGMAQTFGEIISTEEARREFSEMIWKLQDSICSILSDQTADRPTLLQQSLGEFMAAVLTKIPGWLGSTETYAAKIGKKVSAARLQKINAAVAAMNTAFESLKEIISEAGGGEEEEDMSEKNKQQTFDVSKLDDAGKAHVTGLESQITTLKAEIEALKKSGEKKEPEDVLKSASPEIRALFESQKRDAEEARKRADEALELAKAEREKRELAEYVTKAKTMRNVAGISTDDLAGVLKRLNDGTATREDAATVEKALRSTGELASKGGLLSETGVSGDSADSNGTAFEEIQKRAKVLVEKDAKLTMQAAMDHVIRNEPELYKRHMAETRTASTH